MVSRFRCDTFLGPEYFTLVTFGISMCQSCAALRFGRHASSSACSACIFSSITALTASRAYPLPTSRLQLSSCCASHTSSSMECSCRCPAQSCAEISGTNAYTKMVFGFKPTIFSSFPCGPYSLVGVHASPETKFITHFAS